MKIKTISKLLLVIIFAFLLKKENENLYFGKAVNSVFSCSQDPANSFPCYGNWDIWLMIIGLIICISLLVSAVIDFIKSRRGKK